MDSGGLSAKQSQIKTLAYEFSNILDSRMPAFDGLKERPKSRKNLEERRLEGATETAKAAAFMAQRRVLCQIKAGAQGPRLELRLCLR